MGAKAIFIHGISVFYTLSIGVLSLVRLTDLPKLNTGYDDKIAHFLIYAFLCLTWFLSLYIFKIKSSLLLASLASIMFGAIIEVLQGQLSAYRVTEALDLLANTLGVLVMAVIIHVKKEVIIKKL